MRKDRINRKQFLGSCLGSLGYLVFPKAAPAEDAPDLPYAFEETDKIGKLQKNSTGIAIDSKDRLYVAGERGVQIYDAEGKKEKLLVLNKPATCVAVDADDVLYVATASGIQKFDQDGNSIAAWGEKGSEPGQLSYITSLAPTESVVYVADAGNRRISRYAINGDYVDAIEDFLIPSPYFDCTVDEEGMLYVTHTGKHSVEKYDRNHKRIARWGGYGSLPNQFPGCCNPTHIALLPEDRVATTQKGEPCLKLFTRTGMLLAYLGPDAFPKRCKGMDLAVDSKGRVAMLDPVKRAVRFHEIVEL